MAQPKTQYHPSQGLEKIPFVATCLAGFEEQLLLEVERLGISDAKIELRRIEGSCSWAQFCLMAFKSRLAVRLLLPLCKVMMRTSEDSISMGGLDRPLAYDCHRPCGVLPFF
jgi:23S rRNA G2445 N2-methylase RlmL